MNRNKKGFTIVELVIVIAILAILAAVLIPTFASLVKKANEANAQTEAKNLITEMLANILDKDGDADLIVVSRKGNDVYVYGYSKEAGKMISYHTAKSIPSGKNFEQYANELLAEMVTNKAVTEVTGLAGDDWRQPAKTKEIVDQLGSKSEDMIVFANYKIAADKFLYEKPVAVNGKTFDNISEAVAAAANSKGATTITLCRNEAVNYTASAPTTLKDVTFKVADGVKVNGVKLVSESKDKKLTLENIKFEGFDFTDKVVIGQDGSSYGYSQCSNITFENCTFDMSKSTAQYHDAIKRSDVIVSGSIAEKEKTAYLDGITIKNCTFTNVRYGVFLGKVRNVTIEDCTFTNCSSYAIRLYDVAGNLTIRNNTADNTAGFLTINTVGNNYSTTDTATNIVIENNTVTNMTCGNGDVFMTSYDNNSQNGKSTYTITGNTVTYTQAFEEPLIGFRIKSTYGPSVAKFIPQQ